MSHTQQFTSFSLLSLFLLSTFLHFFPILMWIAEQLTTMVGKILQVVSHRRWVSALRLLCSLLSYYLVHSRALYNLCMHVWSLRNNAKKMHARERAICASSPGALHSRTSKVLVIHLEIIISCRISSYVYLTPTRESVDAYTTILLRYSRPSRVRKYVSQFFLQ